MPEAVLLHAVTGPRGSRLEALLGQGLEPIATLRPLVGPPSPTVMRLSGPPALLSEAGADLPQGAAHPEAAAVRLRRLGVELRWGNPVVVDSARALERWCWERGRSSVQILRADRALVTEMQAGSWFNAGWRGRLVRRVAQHLPPAALARRGPSPPRARSLQLRCDMAFWAGVRSTATATEWRRLTRSSYVMLLYHRLAGEGKPGQERIDVDPRTFAAHLRALRLLRFRDLSAADILAFHSGSLETLPARSFAVTLDDGFRDCREPLELQGSLRSQLFVCTRELGGTARWADGEPVMDWSDLVRLAESGVAIGAHGTRHERLVSLDDDALRRSLEGSLGDLRDRLADPLAVLAYPHGAHDERVRTAARAAAFRAAYTTEKGRNGAGTDLYCLRRVSVHFADGPLAMLWKVTTGESLPRPLALGRRLRARVAGTRC